MKILLSILAATIITATATFGSNASVLSPGLLILNESDPMVMSGLTGEPIAFSNDDFCNHTGIIYYDNIKITSLPDSSEGILSVAGNNVIEGQQLSFADCDRLVFSPADTTTTSSFSFSLNDGYDIRCTIKLAENFNYSPTALSAMTAIETFSGMTLNGNMVAHDPEGDPITFEITKYPKGEISYNSRTGNFIYKARTKGKDSFSFVAKDDWGNYSEEAEIELSVSANTTGISFKDMKNNSAYAAAVNVINDGIMTASEANGEVFFEPDSTVSRLDFLIAAMNTMGASNLPDVSKTDFADDNEIPLDAKSYVYSAEKLGIIKGTQADDGKIYFNPNTEITRAEAAVLVNNIIGYSSFGSYSFEDTVPTWAENAISSMFELGIFTTDNGYVNASAKITKAETAQLLDRLKELVY